MNTRHSPDSLPPRSHATKRDAILHAAATVFCREGFAGANIDLVAAEAGVSRQTVYNHHGDKERLFASVVRQVTERSNIDTLSVLATFPDHPSDLQAELTAFAVRVCRSFMCGGDCRFLRKLIQAEGERHPHLFDSWRRQGPPSIWSALGARFARLAHAGFLDIDDPDLAARQFLALIKVDLTLPALFGEIPDDHQLEESARVAVTTFLRAFGCQTDEVEARPDATKRA